MLDMTVREWVKEGQLRGRITFSFGDLLQSFTDVSHQVILNDLLRLKKQGVIYSPYKSLVLSQSWGWNPCLKLAA